MTAEAEIQRLDARLTRVEDDVDARQTRMESEVFKKLDALNLRVTELTVAIAKRPECPAPGTCIGLSERVMELTDNMLHAQSRISRLERWQYGVMAILGALSFVGPAIVFAAGIAIKIHFKL